MNNRITTGFIRARAIDNRHIYTSFIIVNRVNGEFPRYGNLDTYPERVAEAIFA